MIERKKRPMGHFENGFFVLDKPIRSNGRLPQLNKSLRKRGDTDLVKRWKQLDSHGH